MNCSGQAVAADTAAESPRWTVVARHLLQTQLERGGARRSRYRHCAALPGHVVWVVPGLRSRARRRSIETSGTHSVWPPSSGYFLCLRKLSLSVSSIPKADRMFQKSSNLVSPIQNELCLWMFKYLHCLLAVRFKMFDNTSTLDKKVQIFVLKLRTNSSTGKMMVEGTLWSFYLFKVFMVFWNYKTINTSIIDIDNNR